MLLWKIFLNAKIQGVLDFAGGNVVHISSGLSGLMCVIVIGNRKDFDRKKTLKPHNLVYTFVGLCLLWVGWFGFNAGSAVAANGIAANAMLVTQISAATSGFSWMARGRSSNLLLVYSSESNLRN